MSRKYRISRKFCLSFFIFYCINIHILTSEYSRNTSTDTIVHDEILPEIAIQLEVESTEIGETSQNYDNVPEITNQNEDNFVGVVNQMHSIEL